MRQSMRWGSDPGGCTCEHRHLGLSYSLIPATLRHAGEILPAFALPLLRRGCRLVLPANSRQTPRTPSPCRPSLTVSHFLFALPAPPFTYHSLRQPAEYTNGCQANGHGEGSHRVSLSVSDTDLLPHSGRNSDLDRIRSQFPSNDNSVSRRWLI